MFPPVPRTLESEGLNSTWAEAKQTAVYAAFYTFTISIRTING